MRRAFTRLRSGRGGPCLVEVPQDVWNEETDVSSYVPSRALRTGPDPDAIHEAAKMLLAAKRPVLYAGQGVHWAEAWGELRQLAELLAIPVCTSLQGKSAFPETHPLALGSGGLAYPGDRASFPEGGRPHSRHRLLVHDDELRRRDAEGQRPSSTARGCRPT